MDKATFIELAPEYYMLACVQHSEYPQSYYTDDTLVRAFTYTSDDTDDYCFVENNILREEALRRLLRENAISVIDDPFGPKLWQRSANFETFQEKLESSPSSAFFKARASGDPRSWLTNALQKVNYFAREFSITPKDFEAEAMDEWAPITLDQTDPTVADAATQLKAATDAVEQDNGYSIAHPQERDAVVQDLQGGLNKLKSGVVSQGWVRRTFLALKTASFRFANTVKGQTIDGALLALKEVVKSHMGHLMEQLLSWWP